MESEPSPKKGPAEVARRVAVATDLPFLLVGPVLVGGFLGYLLDGWLGVKPLFMIVLGALGFYGGVRALFQRLKLLDQDKHAGNR